MTREQALDLDHDDDRRRYRGMAHASCNRRAGAIKGNKERKGRPFKSRKSVHVDLDDL